jgi:hypothetical protein
VQVIYEFCIHDLQAKDEGRTPKLAAIEAAKRPLGADYCIKPSCL